MADRNYIYKNIRSTSSPIKQAVLAEALERGVTMGDVIGSILGGYYNERYELSGEPIRGTALVDRDQLKIQIPRVIGLRVGQEAKRTKQTESSVILGILAEHYGLIHEPVRKGRKARAAA